MKGQFDRTKVVLRHLPPTITQSMLTEQIDAVFAGRYNWVSFRPGDNSQKKQAYSRAYINFKRPEDVLEFAEFFEGHVFVNEKGSQFKTIVEYAPSQRVPKQSSRKDGREGTILKDPEYLEFLEYISKPVENLPSAEIQLERREAEKTGATKETPIVTPLMDYIRQKRASKGASRRSISSEKQGRRATVSSSGASSSGTSKRSSEKRRNSTIMYVLRDGARSSNGKDKPTYILASRRDDPQLSEKSSATTVSAGSGQQEEDIGTADSGKRKVLLLKGKEREIPQVSADLSSEKSQVRDAIVKQNHRHESSGRIIRSILMNKDARQNQSGSQFENQHQISHPGKDRRPPRPPSFQATLKDSDGALNEKVHGNGLPGFAFEKQERRTRSRDRPDRGVWAPLRRSDGIHTNEMSSSSSPPQHSVSESPEGFRKSAGRRGQSQSGKDVDGAMAPSEGKFSKRGTVSAYASHEKQVWVQKSSGS